MPSALVVGTNTWISRADATTYFDDRSSQSVWTDASNDDKDRALLHAYKILHAGDFSTFPDSAPTQNMKDAQCEVAYYLLDDGGGVDTRKNLQQQGVTGVRIGPISENYSLERVNKIPYPPIVLKLLEGYYTGGEGGMFAGDLARDENESV